MIRITALLASIFVIGTAQADEQLITLSSTMSAQDSGLFNYILPIFRASTGLTVQVVAVGTGRALAIAERGDADALLVHDPIGEAKFIADGFGIDLRGVMYDDFVIVGPDRDPAGIRHLKDAPKAFGQIANAGALFASRGDDSGTNRAELRLWKLAGIQPGPRSPWYRKLDQGMGLTLDIAAAMNALHADRSGDLGQLPQPATSRNPVHRRSSTVQPLLQHFGKSCQMATREIR